MKALVYALAAFGATCIGWSVWTWVRVTAERRAER